MKASYDEVMCYTAQRAFRKAWASKLWGKVEKKRLHKHQMVEEEGSISRFCPVESGLMRKEATSQQFVGL